MTPSGALTLSDVPVGTRVRIRHLSARPEVSRRLREMGLRENAEVSCIMRGFGNLLCVVHNTRIGINDGLASSIIVTHPE